MSFLKTVTLVNIFHLVSAIYHIQGNNWFNICVLSVLNII